MILRPPIDGVPTEHIWLTVSDFFDAMEKFLLLKESLNTEKTKKFLFEMDRI